MGDFNGIPITALLPVAVLLIGFVFYCWWDIWHQASVNYLPKSMWAFICVVSIPLGGIIYLLIGRNE